MRKFLSRRDKRRSVIAEPAISSFGSATLEDAYEFKETDDLNDSVADLNLRTVPRSTSLEATKRNLIKGLSTKRSTTSLAANASSSGVQSLIDPQWDAEVLKVGWLNKLPDDIRDGPRLCRAEVKGSSLLVYRPPPELEDVKCFDIDKESSYRNVETSTTSEISLHSSMDEESTLFEEQSRSRNPTILTKLPPEVSGSQFSIATSLSSANVHLEHAAVDYPHPDLELSSDSRTIVDGSLESLCHAVLFNPNRTVSEELLQILPLVANVNTALQYFQKYIQVMEQTEKVSASKHVAEHNNKMVVWAGRLALVVETITNRFSGLLLDEEVLSSIWTLLVFVDIYQPSDSLKTAIFLRYQELTKLRSADTESGRLADLPAKTFLETPLETLASTINAINLKYSASWNPQRDESLLYENASENHPQWRSNPLLFRSPNNLHYLARLLSYHLFEDPQVTTAAQRAEVLGKWIQLGSLLNSVGDMVNWLAIATVICSTPILRLTKTWAAVSADLVQLVSCNWAPVAFELDRRAIVSPASHRASYHVLAPQGIGKNYPKENVVPYFGDLFVKKAQYSFEDAIRHVSRIHASFAKWDEYLKDIRNSRSAMKSIHTRTEDPETLQKLNKVFGYHIQSASFGLNAIMEHSLRVEPAYTGQFSKLHDKSRTSLFLGSYAALLFPETLKSYRIFERDSMVGAIGGGKTSHTAISQTLPRAGEEASKLMSRNQFLKAVRDIFDVDSHEFHVDDTIVFKTNDGPAVKGRLQESSLLLSESMSVKRFSNYSSNSLSLDEYFNTVESMVEENEAKKEKLSVEILTKAATVDKLLNLLVLTYSTFGSKFKEQDVINFVGDTPPDSIELKMDNGVFNMTFFAVYRGFCSTTDVLEGMKKRFIGARAAARALEQGTEPDWDAVNVGRYAETNWKFVAQIQLGVLEILLILVENYYHHFVDNLENKTIFDTLLRTIDNETIVQWSKILLWLESDEFVNREYLQQVRRLYTSITEIYKKMRKTYVRKCYRPQTGPIVPVFTSNLTIVPADRLLPRSGDSDKLTKFVEDLDTTLASLYSLTTLHDWIDTFEILETHASESPLSLSQYDSQPVDVAEDKMVVSNVYCWLASVKDSNGQYLVNKFPAGVRCLFEFYFRLKAYLATQILDPGLQESDREDRMRVATKLLGITSSKENPRVPGMLESCLVDVILSPESRTFAHIWKKIAQTESLDSVEQLVPELPGLKVLPCPGWLAERLLEIACFIPNKSVENTNLINFDKRRFAYNCISNTLDNVPDSESSPLETPFGFLFECSCMLPTLAELCPSTEPIFSRQLEQQKQLLAIEASRRRLLVKQTQSWTAPRETHRDHRRDSVRVSRSVPIRPSSSSSSSSKFKLGGLLKSRPFSVNMGHGERISGVDELGVADDFIDSKQRPVVAVNLKEYTIFPVYQTPSSFKLSSPSQELSFQAISDPEKNDWLYQLNFAKKHWFWSKSANKYTHHNFVFGVPLEFICERESREIPGIIEKMMSEIEYRGLEETGLYRKSASVSVLNEIREVVDLNGDLNMEHQLVFDVHNLTGVIKLFFRELPEPLITNSVIPEFEKIKQLAQSTDRFDQYKEIMAKLPSCNRTLLARFVKHLKMVDEYNQQNKMPASNLAKVIGGLFIEGCRPENNQYFGLMTFVCEDLILNYDQVWTS
ncbi:hypothetical protein OGAPHI_005322 [Ogataea philodendri]|uniref:Uncharacterized protein n=2 Tax=Saccharomycotina TaxID=147537 RepID=A0A9P8P170_9ASCO|nr:uncharacterized protein OGAPHI_005322 [Ogataea philodendri]KAH3663332.1 hypothetical protein OGAPHI_005322 [Ogataea philodendri]